MLRSATPGCVSRQRSGRMVMLDELQIVQPSVDASPAQQLLMLADFDDLALFEHHDLVGGAYSRKPMRDHERRTAAHQVAERLLHKAFGFGIESGCGLVSPQG